jgi:hypothetical protein
MATRGVSMTIQYVAVDTTTNMGKTGDAANHTLRWVKDGTPAAPTNSPAEVDATNCPGIYKLTLTASETNCNIGTLGGKSSTANVAIIPITIQFERLPDAAPGASGGVPVIGQAPLTNLDAAVSSRADAAYYTSARAANLDNLDAAISTRATESGVWGYSSRSLTAAVDVNMSQSLPSSPGAGTVGEALKFADTRLDAAVGSRATESGVWDYTTRTLTGTVDLNMDQAAPENPTANTVGDAIKSAARMKFTASDDVYAWSVNESGGGGGGGGSGGSGPYAVTTTVYEGQTPLEGASVRLLLGAEDYSLMTNAAGQCTFYVGAGTWTWRVAKPGYMGRSGTIVVSDDASLDVRLTRVTIVPSPAGQTTGYGVVYDEMGNPEPNVTVYCRLVNLDVSGLLGDAEERSSESNAHGLVQFPGLLKGATYAFRRGSGAERLLRVPTGAGDMIVLPPLMGKE